MQQLMWVVEFAYMNKACHKQEVWPVWWLGYCFSVLDIDEEMKRKKKKKRKEEEQKEEEEEEEKEEEE